MRIDRLLCELQIGSRNEVKALLKKGLIAVNGEIITRPETKVNETTVTVSFRQKEYRYCPYYYYMMNKPGGVISATKDAYSKTVLDLLKENLQKKYGEDFTGIPLSDLFPVGRLDKDTAGLLLLTNDGKMAHELLSPGKHIEKTYYVKTDGTITKEAICQLESGVDIGEKKPTKPAKVTLLSDNSCTISITEGKYHQIKRMFHAVHLNVTYLKRLSMGSLILDETLPEGSVRELTQEEVARLWKQI